MTAKRVLVVDDEPDIRTVIAMNLTLAGMDTDEAADGNEALVKLDRDSWNGCILDLVMPGANGFDVLAHISGNESYDDLSVIVLSAHGQPATAIQALQLGAHDHMTKPFAPASLAQMMKELMEMSRPERAERRDEMLDRATNLERLGMKTI